MLRTLREFWRDERGGIITTETVGYVLIIGGAAAMIGYGLAAAMRGLAGKNVKTIKCADPSYAAAHPECSTP